jgi:DNA mismatch endonuclease (patch repair protein)
MDRITEKQRSENMRAIKSKDTAPELAVRRLIHGMGYRYRLHGRGLPGKPDLVFSSRKKVIFMHGCFWHQHGCSRSTTPKSNTDYWQPKLERNKNRDELTLQALKDLNWKTMVIWECEITKKGSLKKRIRNFLK